ncbi:MAG TPA: hypothetical protein VGL56_14995 [Fimbriimonadaceae bacterium]|jgi:hypothetical protein
MAQPAHIQPVLIPEDLRSLLLAKFGDKELSAWVTEAVVVEAVRQHVISRNKGATLLGLNDYEAREAFFDRHELFNEYTMEMLEQDFKTIERHLRESKK